MKVYKVYQHSDIGGTETFCPTKREAKDLYDVWADQDGDEDVEMETIDFEPNRVSICDMINAHVTR